MEELVDILITNIFPYFINGSRKKSDFLNLRTVCLLWRQIVDEHFILRKISNDPIKIYFVGRNHFRNKRYDYQYYLFWKPRSNQLFWNLDNRIDLFQPYFTLSLFEYRSLLNEKVFAKEMTLRQLKSRILYIFRKHSSDSKLSRLSYGINKLFGLNQDDEMVGNFYKRIDQFFSQIYHKFKFKARSCDILMERDQLWLKDGINFAKYFKPMKQWDIIVYVDPLTFLHSHFTRGRIS